MNFIIKFGNSVKKSEIKVVTYIDLITQVAGVPSFLFIIAQFTMKNFENFHSDLQMTQTFKSQDNMTDQNFGFLNQLCVFLFYENPVTRLLRCLCNDIKCCQRKTGMRARITKIQHMSKLLQRKLDLKKLLFQFHNFELSMNALYKKLNVKRHYDDEFVIMGKWKQEFINHVSDKIKIHPQRQNLDEKVSGTSREQLTIGPLDTLEVKKPDKKRRSLRTKDRT